MSIKFLDEDDEPQKSTIRFLDEEDDTPSTRSTIRFLDEPVGDQQPFSLEDAERRARERTRQRMGVEPTPELAPTAATSGRPVRGTPKQEEAPKLSITDVAADDDLFNRANAYMKASGGKPYKEGEDKEDFINRFVSRRTFMETSTTFGQTRELARLVGGTDETKKAIAEGRDLYDQMAYRGGVRPVLDVARGIGSDIPLAILTGGVGKVAGGATLKLASKGASTAAMTTAGRLGVAVAEATLGGAARLNSTAH
jgi:hypothetical protein